MIIKAASQAEADRLSNLLNIISSVPEGKALVELAEKRLDVFCFDASLNKDQRGAYETEEGGDRRIALNPRFPDEVIISTLVHELRHMWQDAQLDFLRDRELTVLDAVIFNRLLEGDANAFSAAICTELRAATGMPVHRQLYGTIGFRAVTGLFSRLAGKFNDPTFIRKRVFENFQRKENLNTRLTHRFLPKEFFFETYDGRTMETAKNGSKSLSQVFKNAASVFSYTDKDGQHLYLRAKDIEDLSRKVLKFVPVIPVVRQA